MKHDVEGILFWVLIVIVIIIGIIGARAEEANAWVMCQPDSFVNIRQTPEKTGRVIGYLQLADGIQTDGKTHNGYCHITGATTESGEGWVARAYIVTDPPQVETVAAWVDSDGRVACRRAIGGNRRKWLHGGDRLTLYASSAEWSITSEGFVQTEYILAER